MKSKPLVFIGLGAAILYALKTEAKSVKPVVPPAVPPVVPPANRLSNLRMLADLMILSINSSAKYKENRQLVYNFQMAFGGLKLDGMYGPKTALSVAKIGLIPKKPIYWSKATAREDKNAYVAEISVHANAPRLSPEVKNQWLEAMNLEF